MSRTRRHPIVAALGDARGVMRGLRRAPAFTALGVLTLALGVGANAATFSIVDRLLLRGPAQVANPQAVRRVYVTTRDAAGAVSTAGIHPYALYALVRDHATAFSGAAAYTLARAQFGGEDGYAVPIGYATASFFDVLGTRPAIGRFFLTQEDNPPLGTNVAVLSYRFWRQAFGGDPRVVGRKVTVNSRQFIVVGVASLGFTGAELAPVDLWIPMSARAPGASPNWPYSWNAAWTRIVVRLAPSTTVTYANANLTVAFRRFHSGQVPNGDRATVSARPLGYTSDGGEPDAVRVARLLYALSCSMLIVAAANVANLVSARAVRRRPELAVRRALGAGRARLVCMLMGEAGALALLGGLAGSVLAWWARALIGSELLPELSWAGAYLDAHVLASTAAAMILTAIVAGAWPALRSGDADLRSDSAKGGRAATRQDRLSGDILLLTQIALSVVLLSTGGLFVRSLVDIHKFHLGLEPDRVLVATIAPSSMASRVTGAGAQAPFEAVLEGVRHMAGVQGASLQAGTVPFRSALTVPVRVDGMSAVPTAKGGGPFVSAITSDYFRTVGGVVLRGRAFRSYEGMGTEPTAIVNETLARLVWPNDDPLTKCLRVGGSRNTPCARIVGVAADSHQWELHEDPPMQVYVPYGQAGIDEPVLLVRPKAETTALIGPLRRALANMAPDFRVMDVSTLGSALDPQVRPWRAGSALLGIFGLATLATAAVGLFTVVSYLVARRTHEFGIRVALGARSSRILWMVIRRALGATLIGTGIGVLGIVSLAPIVQPLLFDNPARDPAVIGVVALVFSAAAVAASLVPALRACRVDPLVALRSD